VLDEPDRERARALLATRAEGREALLVTTDEDLARAVARLSPPGR
jgi:hypothetical protein